MDDDHHNGRIFGSVHSVVILRDKEEGGELKPVLMEHQTTAHEIDLRKHPHPEKFLEKVRKRFGEKIAFSIAGDALRVEMTNMSAKDRVDSLVKIDNLVKNDVCPVITRGHWKE